MTNERLCEITDRIVLQKFSSDCDYGVVNVVGVFQKKYIVCI